MAPGEPHRFRKQRTFGVLEVLVDLRYGVLDRAADLLGALVYCAGVGLMFWGARSLPRT